MSHLHALRLTEKFSIFQSFLNETSQELLQVNHALQRIEQGEYGECEECGAEINPKRLKIMPYTTLCIKCAQALEYKYKNIS
ncbi:MAG TPA: hypothetical protein ENJ44_07850 [Oceanospirillales bacterium]|nr:hypothetical protein [Oceanospirillales bacterium]